MKIKVLFAIAFLVSVAGVAQETGYHPGAIITRDNERIEGLIKNVNLVPARILEKIKFKRAEGEKVTAYSPDELLAYEFNGDLYLSKKTQKGEAIFVKKFNNGQLVLYGALTFDGSASYHVRFIPYIQLDNDQHIRKVQKSSFEKQMLEYLKDAPRVCRLISERALKWKDIGEVVVLYNQEMETIR